MYGFIYITTNLINNKKYIGQRKYYKGWQSYLGSGTALKCAISKYGKSSFKREIISEAKDKDELNRLEVYFIDKFDAVNSNEYYNIAKGGEVIVMPPEKQKIANLKLSERYSGVNAIWYGRHHSKESKEKIRKRRKELLASGWINPMTGKKHSEETKKKMSKSMTGISRSDNAKANISKSVKDRSPNVYAVKSDIAYKFNCTKDMADWLIENGNCHTNKIANVKKSIMTRFKNNKEYFGYVFFRNELKTTVETIEKIT